MDETSALDTELNTATDSVNDEAAATSTSMLDPAATDNSSNAGDAQAASGGSNADDSSADAQDSNIKDSSSKATNNVNATTQSDQQADSKKKYKQPQQPNPIKAQLARFSQCIKASRTYSDLQIRTTPDFGCGCAPQAMEEAPEVPVYVVCRSDGAD